MELPSESFLDLPVLTDLRSGGANAVILGIPHGVRYPHQSHPAGSAAAPAAVRAASRRFAPFIDHHDFDLGGPLLPEGFRVVDAGDVPDEGPDAATEAIRAIVASGAVPVVIGGDDSIPIPVLRGYADDGPLTVVQIDAHLDFRDEVAGVRDGYSSPMRRASEMPWVERIVQVGLRGVGSATPADLADAEAAGNLLFTAREVQDLGIETVFDSLRDDAGYFVSLDCDGLDPSIMPAVNAPLPGGLTFAECAALLRGLAQRGRIAGLAVTELLPERDVNELSALVVVRLIWTLLGAIARGQPV